MSPGRGTTSGDPGQDPGVLDPDGAEVVRVQAEQGQDRRRDLGGLDGGADRHAVRAVAGSDNQDGYVAVGGSVAAVLSDLALLRGVHHALLGDTDHVRYPGAVVRYPDEVRRGRTGVDRRQPGRGERLRRRGDVVAGPGGPAQEGGREAGRRGRAVGQPDQHPVVVDREGDQGARVPGGVPRGVERVDDRAVVDPGELGRYGRRLPVLGGDHDGGTVGEPLGGEFGDEPADLGVDGGKRAGQDRSRGDTVSEVPARLTPGGGQLLAGGHGLEVHPEDGRGADPRGAAVVVPVDLVEHRLDLVPVVPPGQ